MISFVITILNRPDMLTRFFSTMPPQSGEVEWILVDNASGDETKQLEYWLQGHIPGVTLVENGRNEGFGVGNNLGVEHSTGDTIVLTQPDVSFNGDVSRCLQGLLDGILYGHQLLNYDTGWNRFGSLIVSYLTGYFLAFTRSTWETLGGFDPIYYPADFEDVDLSYCATHKGVALKVVDVPVSHSHFGSTWAQFPNREQVTIRNRELFARKWGL